MKLKNKLLPLVGVSAVCATVAPIALTSCTNSDLIDLTQKYTGSDDLHAYQVLTEEQALLHYCNRLAIEPSTFADDFYWSQSRFNTNYYYNPSVKEAAETTPAAEQRLVDLDEIKAIRADVVELSKGEDFYVHYGDGAVFGASFSTSSHVSVDNEKITDFSIRSVPYEGSKTVYAISFKREFEIEYATVYNQMVPSKSGSPMKISYTATTKQNGTIEFKDIPITLAYNWGDSSNIMMYLWWVAINTDMIDQVLSVPENNSYIKLNYTYANVTNSSDGSSVETGDTFSITIDKNNNWSKAIAKYEYQLAYITLIGVSHYMYNVACKISK